MAEITSLRELRRHQIIKAARQLIVEKGIAALTFSELEGRLDFSRGVITYHFKNKDDILIALIQSAVVEINEATGQAIVSGGNMGEKLTAMVLTTVRGFVKRPEAGIILMSFWSRIPSNPHVAEINAKLHRTWRFYAGELVKQAQERGVFRETDAEPIAANVVAIVLGIVTQHFFEPHSFDYERAAGAACKAMVSWLEVPK
jgi:AcrR family transcriptional regulator